MDVACAGTITADWPLGANQKSCALRETYVNSASLVQYVPNDLEWMSSTGSSMGLMRCD